MTRREPPEIRATIYKRDPHRSLAQAIEQLRYLLAQPHTRRKQIVQAWSTVRALAKTCESSLEVQRTVEDLGSRSTTSYGITDAIRSVLFLARRPLKTVEIREQLSDNG